VKRVLSAQPANVNGFGGYQRDSARLAEARSPAGEQADRRIRTPGSDSFVLTFYEGVIPKPDAVQPGEGSGVRRQDCLDPAAEMLHARSFARSGLRMTQEKDAGEVCISPKWATTTRAGLSMEALLLC
jgi:hypothetical protein